jgi:hypothetical protein
MTYQYLKHLKPSAFKRRCGVRPEIFAQMAGVLQPCLDRSGKRGGQCKLSVEDPLLLVLEYWREYHTHQGMTKMHRDSCILTKKPRKAKLDALSVNIIVC